MKKMCNCKHLFQQIFYSTFQISKYSTTEIGKHIPCRYSMSTIWAFDNVESKYSLYRGEDCMKQFSVSLREHARDVINFERKKMFLLTEKKLKPHQDSTVCYIC